MVWNLNRVALGRSQKVAGNDVDATTGTLDMQAKLMEEGRTGHHWRRIHYAPDTDSTDW